LKYIKVVSFQEEGMLKIIFTLDYEIHGNGDGSPEELMIKPTGRLMDLLEKYKCRLTIFADVAEIMRFHDYFIQKKEDRFQFNKIKLQLQDAVLRGHDVQLHIHSSWFGAEFINGRWEQKWEEYDFASLGYDKIHRRIEECKLFLENIIRERVPGYQCRVFRAANWAMQPTENIARALVGNGIRIDSSVYKYGKHHDWVKFDYTDIYDSTFPYTFSLTDVCRKDPDSKIWEFPIHSELRPLSDFISPVRIFRITRAMFHRHRKNPDSKTGNLPLNNSGVNKSLFLRARKFDFNQLSGGQMIEQLRKIKAMPGKLPYLTISGHSKSFIRYNEFTLERFLKYINRNNSEYCSSLYPSPDELPD